MKRICYVLLVALIGCLVFPIVTLAADEATSATEQAALSQQLTQVVEKVKRQISIDDSWQEFSGYSESGPAVTYWRLNWYKQDQQLSITATADGVICRYSWSIADQATSDGYFAPQYPKVTWEQAKKNAETFLNSVLREGESAIFDSMDAHEDLYNLNSFSFNGVIGQNNLSTPLTFRIRLSADGKQVVSFSRDIWQEDHVGSIPSAQAKISLAQAAASLGETNRLELAYFLQDGEEQQAALQYRPKGWGNYLLDAQSGKLIDLDEAYEGADNQLYTAEATASGMATDSDSGLTQVELSGINDLTGVLTKDELWKKVQNISDLQIDNHYTLANVDYFEEGAADQKRILVELTMWREATAASLGMSASELAKAVGSGKAVLYKRCLLDAKTGELLQLSTSYPAQGKKWNEQTIAQSQAAAFLSQFPAVHFAETIWNEDDSIPSDFTFWRQVDDYPYYNDYCFVSFNPYTGEVDGFRYHWDASIQFLPAEEIINAEQALAAYNQALNVKLVYASLPVAVDPAKPNLRPFADYGYAYVYQPILAYRQMNDAQVYAIDAVSGQALCHDVAAESDFTYSDLNGGGAVQAAVEKLAQYGVGFAGGQFKAQAQLNQEDMLAFILSAAGYRFDVEEEQDEDQLYATAYQYGLLNAEERNPQALITRGQFIQTLLDMSGYGKAAGLSGIYKCTYRDAASIPQALYGYAAIAQGLDLLDEENFQANSVITRGVAALVFDRFMGRQN